MNVVKELVTDGHYSMNRGKCVNLGGGTGYLLEALKIKLNLQLFDSLSKSRLRPQQQHVSLIGQLYKKPGDWVYSFFQTS